MNIQPRIRPVSKLLEDFCDTLPRRKVTLDDVLEAFHERGFGFLILLFSLPMTIPIPFPPGLNIIISLPLIVLTVQQALGRRTVWMPESFRKKATTTKRLKYIIEQILPGTKFVEIFIRPRLGFMTQGIFSRMIGVTGLLMALFGCIPLPLTNTVPNLGISLMAIGVLMRDGLAVLAGMLIGLGWMVVFSYALVTYGAEGIEWIMGWITT